MNTELAFEYIDANRDRFLDELKAFVRQPSISATGEGVEDCARLLKQLMEDVGVDTQIIEGYGHPVLYGEVRAPDATRTILVYGHYDVQPPDPLSEWLSPPFEPEVRSGKLYGRGTGDNKGQLFAQLKGIEAIIPSTATMKIDMRLIVPQSPDDLFEKLKAYLNDIGYGDLEIRKLGQMTPWRTPLDDPSTDRVCRAVEKGFGAAPYRVPSLGGSLPLAEFTHLPGATIILVPYGQHDENNHSPNECFSVDHFFKGARTMVALLNEMRN